jgi:streptogrisin C
MRSRAGLITIMCGSALAAQTFALAPGSAGVGADANAVARPTAPVNESSAPQAQVEGVARALGISEESARDRLLQQDRAQQTYKQLPSSVVATLVGHWFDAKTGNLTIGVTSPADARRAEAAGAEARVVPRTMAELDQRVRGVRREVGRGVPGLVSFGIDVTRDDVLVNVNPARATSATQAFLRTVRALDGVRVAQVSSTPVQQSGEVNPGDPWWPGSETNCSVGFTATDANGGKHFLTAGHCTNDADQPAYGASGQQNRLGTSNVGGSRSVNGHEGDMGVVAVTEAGWTVSPNVNTWGSPAVTVSGSADAMVGDAVCHSGNTAPNWECGEVTKVNQTVTYNNGSLVIDGLTFTTACSEGGDSGGAWLSGDKAVGLHEGGLNGNSCPAGEDNAIFQPVNEALSKWGLTLVTGGGTPGVDTEAPTAPGNPQATGSTANSVSLSWTASTDNVGVTAYDVYNGSTLATTVTGTSATVSSLAPDTSYTFTVKARDAAGNVSAASSPVTARTQPGDPGGGRTFTNETDYPIRDYQVAISKVQSSATGAAANPVTVSISASHTCQQDLQIGVVSPSGHYYELQHYGYDNWNCTAFPGTRTFTFAPSNEQAAGTWTLRIGDNGAGDTGVLTSWSLTV